MKKGFFNEIDKVLWNEFVSEFYGLEPEDQNNIFDGLNLEEKKKKEVLLAKKGKGHYRSMVEDEKLYQQIMQCVLPFISRDMVSMLWHTHDTNLNEAMNRSVSSFAPKDRTFCRTMSLQTRVSIAAGVQILGHYEFWNQVLTELGLTMSMSMETILKRRDRANAHRQLYRRRVDVKRKKRNPDVVKINEGIEERKRKIKDGTYSSGIAIAAEQQAKEIIKKVSDAAKQQNKNLPIEKQVCKFYLHYCKKKGHNLANSKLCDMHGKTGAEKKAAMTFAALGPRSS